MATARDLFSSKALKLKHRQTHAHTLYVCSTSASPAMLQHKNNGKHTSRGAHAQAPLVGSDACMTVAWAYLCSSESVQVHAYCQTGAGCLSACTHVSFATTSFGNNNLLECGATRALAPPHHQSHCGQYQNAVCNDRKRVRGSLSFVRIGRRSTANGSDVLALRGPPTPASHSLAKFRACTLFATASSVRRPVGNTNETI